MAYPLTERWLSELGLDLHSAYAGVGPCHDLGHAVRVSALAEQIARAEDIDGLGAVLAALLHDAGHAAAARAGSDDHEQSSAAAATRILHGRVSPAVLDCVVDAISGRRFAKLSLPRDPAGAILDDADNLDAIGFCGIARAFLWLGEHGRPLDLPGAPGWTVTGLAQSDMNALYRHWSEKLARLPAVMRTQTGARIASRRAADTSRFLRRLEDELSEILSRPDQLA